MHLIFIAKYSWYDTAMLLAFSTFWNFFYQQQWMTEEIKEQMLFYRTGIRGENVVFNKIVFKSTDLKTLGKLFIGSGL